MKTMAAMLMLAVAASPGTMAAQQAPSPSPVADVPRAIGELYAPREMMKAKTAAHFDKSFRAGLARSQDTARIEQQFPGIMDAAGSAARRVVIDAMDAKIAGLQNQIAAFVAADFTAPEQQGLLAFMQSSTGRKLVSMGDEIYDTDKLVKQAAQAGATPAITQQQMASSLDYGFIGKMTPDELKQMAAFGVTPAGRKLQASTAKLQQLVVTWVNAFMAEQQGPIQTAVVTAMQQYVAKAKKAK